MYILLIRNFIVHVALFILIISCSSQKMLKPFKSDGCSFFPDQSLINKDDLSECCIEHDMAYWQGGTKTEREQADKMLKECILTKTNDEDLANMMYVGVRFGGSPYFPTWYRWGYGWNYHRGYDPLTDEEKKMVQIRLAEYKLKKRI